MTLLAEDQRPTLTPSLAAITRDLLCQFGGVLSRERVERCAWAAARRFEGAKIEAFVPVLVHRAARDVLQRHVIRARRGPARPGRPDGRF